MKKRSVFVFDTYVDNICRKENFYFKNLDPLREETKKGRNRNRYVNWLLDADQLEKRVYEHAFYKLVFYRKRFFQELRIQKSGLMFWDCDEYRKYNGELITIIPKLQDQIFEEDQIRLEKQKKLKFQKKLAKI